MLWKVLDAGPIRGDCLHSHTFSDAVLIMNTKSSLLKGRNGPSRYAIE